MSRFSDKLREAISVTGISQTAIAHEAHISRQVVNYTLMRRCRPRPIVAQMMTITLSRALDKKIEEKRREIDELMRIKHELREAVDTEYREQEHVGK